MEISFTVEAQPLAQPRPRARAFPNGGIQIYNPNNKAMKDYKALILEKFLEAKGDSDVPLDKPVEVTVQCWMKRPQTYLNKKYDDLLSPHTQKPDLDNLAKPVLDALNGVAWKDDSQIFELRIQKWRTLVELAGKSGRKRISGEPNLVVHIKYSDLF